MDEKCKAALELLVQNGYLEAVKGKYRATRKLNEVQAVEAWVIDTQGDVLKGSWEEIYTKFIIDCKIPRKGEAGDGSLYDLNKYSEDAMKHFRDLMKAGIQYALLVQVTKAYYSSGSIRYKKTIGNYITQGYWRMDYEAVKAAKDQSLEQQQQTLKELMHDPTTFTRDRIG